MYMYLTKKQLQSTILAKWTYKHFDFHYCALKYQTDFLQVDADNFYGMITA